MPTKGHTEEQIVAVLRQVEAGERVADICRKVGISQATYYQWKRQYAGLGVSELRELAAAARGEWALEAASGGSERGPADPSIALRSTRSLDVCSASRSTFYKSILKGQTGIFCHYSRWIACNPQSFIGRSGISARHSAKSASTDWQVLGIASLRRATRTRWRC